MTSLRAADDRDLDAILAIHNDAIAHSRAIWTDALVDRREREQWLAARREVGHPVVVAEVDGVVAGYATYGPWRLKSGYRYTVEDSIYLDRAFRGQGIGGLLLGEIIRIARERGLRVMIADIEAGNTASIRLHERFGFTHAGLLRGIGTKFDERLDLAILELPLDS
ncbi:GNAT family N-acetyltransferase [Microbacterium kyungheense]|uniref:Phosphinothricin acetyltransferase n=1 Tax=Microbacterium kyungheense TaxID=1263636 RepID=A0A543F167_9MICO|nr:GNAT family N-acetyltransferase [Microbacterium kyungheense]TQM27530.1 phosphinothricin acetyltransferase [Microbacterium kyungheense]